MTTTIAQLPALEKRRQALAIQRARYGISADPHVDIELQDLDILIGLMERIDIHRANVAHLLQQRGHFGASVPPHVVNQLNHERESIACLRAACAKHGQPVEPHPVDADAATVEAGPAIVTLPPDPIQRVREALRDIEALLRHGQSAAALGAVQGLRQEIGG